MIPGLGRSAGEGIGSSLQYSWASLVAQMVKNLPAVRGDLGFIPGLGTSPGGGFGNPLQYSCLENPHGQRSLGGYSPSDQIRSVAQSCPTLCDPIDCTVHGLLQARIPAEPEGKANYTEVGTLSLLQGIFPTQELNQGLPHGRQILYQLSHKGSPRILDCIAYPFSSGSSQPRNRTRVSCIAGGFFTNWATRERPLTV